MNSTFTPARSTTKAQKIAIVEDDEHMAQLLRYNLVADGFDVDLLHDGCVALSRITDVRPNLVVLDWSLPGLSGIEVLRQMRSSPVLCTTPVIMLTARCTPEDRARAMSTGADVFLAKPFSIQALSSALERLFSNTTPKASRQVAISK